MRIHRLEIQAFGPFAGREVVDFDQLGSQGLFLLNGATGAGKSSVLDAIAYALYGRVPGAPRDSYAATTPLRGLRLWCCVNLVRVGDD